MGSFSIHQISQSGESQGWVSGDWGSSNLHLDSDAIRMLGYQLIDSDAGWSWFMDLWIADIFIYLLVLCTSFHIPSKCCCRWWQKCSHLTGCVTRSTRELNSLQVLRWSYSLHGGSRRKTHAQLRKQLMGRVGQLDVNRLDEYWVIEHCPSIMAHGREIQFF